MPRHTLNLHLPPSTITKTDVEVVVFSDDAILGRLLISKGGVDWWPAKKRRFHYRMGWEKFADRMEQPENRRAAR
jgi:hypothetical protein